MYKSLSRAMIEQGSIQPFVMLNSLLTNKAVSIWMQLKGQCQPDLWPSVLHFSPVRLRFDYSNSSSVAECSKMYERVLIKGFESWRIHKWFHMIGGYRKDMWNLTWLVESKTCSNRIFIRFIGMLLNSDDFFIVIFTWLCYSRSERF